MIKVIIECLKNLDWKKYLYIALGVVLCVLLTITIVKFCQLKKYKYLYEKELQNVAAYQVSNSSLEGEVIQYRMTIDDLYASKDSLDQKMLSIMNQLKISDKKVKELQYQLSQATRTDTVTLHDTIFKPEVNIDTIIGDYWYNLRLQLRYPSTIVTTPTLNSEQYVYIYNKKEYKGGKSKCFFVNWFKKKYTVTEVKVEEKNPHIKLTKQKFINVEK